eukprot:CAMPEP_0174386028 /NCGR_PEP_ID=MMETSP0811_2-20130205/127000_1 /TAXON_ID=73025 ORGANISM="Eutreptiella gymnastica-like, Strain CCMP1594" /NCGR_SAMPLE_ID=MMETSP0811_2 /ASSEMBLY_ACC=CAM_ASM_000667 /LENGTH=54 /DNA_ID=CAMNT_0015540557 /DNA_START=1643 /DNA_END=1807 /DNA_ORIENTATION=-
MPLCSTSVCPNNRVSLASSIPNAGAGGSAFAGSVRVAGEKMFICGKVVPEVIVK